MPIILDEPKNLVPKRSLFYRIIFHLRPNEILKLPGFSCADITLPLMLGIPRFIDQVCRVEIFTSGWRIVRFVLWPCGWGWGSRGGGWGWFRREGGEGWCRRVRRYCRVKFGAFPLQRVWRDGGWRWFRRDS